MNKKLTRKEKQAAQPKGPSRQQQHSLIAATQKTKRWLGLLLAAVAMLVYANTVNHQYVLDDWGLIPENKITRKGTEGLGEIFKTSYRTGMDIPDYSLYRPLSKATFAIEWEIAPNNPQLGHINNILMYGLCCYLLFLVLVRLFNGKWIVPFITALLFAVHPIHTEVLANIKSRDEILAMIFLILSLGAALTYVTRKGVVPLFILSGCFFLAMLSKESSITWIAVIPLALYFFTEAKKSDVFNVTLAAVIPSVLFLLIRRSILGSADLPIPVADNYLAGIPDFLTQRTSAIAILGFYFYKLFVPYPLMADASFSHFPPYNWNDWHFLVTLLVFLGLIWYALRRFTAKDPVAFAILYFFITISIVSNVLLLIGTNYAERLLFAPSLGWCLAIAVVLGRVFERETSEDQPPLLLMTFFKKHSRLLAFTAVLSLVFFGVATSRNAAWETNYKLYTTDIAKVPNSAHMRFYLANHITSEEYLTDLGDSVKAALSQEQAILQLDTAIMINEKYADAYQRRGYIRYSKKEYPRAEVDFKKALDINPTEPVAHNNYGNLLFNSNRFDEAKVQFEQAIRYNPRYAHALNNLASIYGVMGEGERQAIQADPLNAAQHSANAKRNYETAIGYFQKAIKEDPEYPTPYYLMGITYRNLGDEQTARTYIQKSEEVKKIKRYNAGN